MKAILLNDSSHYHVGSKAVTSSILRLAKAQGISITSLGHGQELPQALKCDLVIVNGEGTFHHNSARAIQIHAMAKALKDRGARAVLINTVIQNMELDYSIYDRVVTRESLSARHLSARHPAVRVEVIPDLAFCHTAKVERPIMERRGVMFIDSVVDQHSRILDDYAAAHGAGALRLCAWKGSVDGLLELMSRKELVVTGRFHGAVLAVLAGTPFLAMPSNTWKTQGMMEDLGLSSQFCQTETQLSKALAQPAPPAAAVDLQGILEQWERFFSSLTNHGAELPSRLLLPAPVAITQSIARPGASCVLVGNGPSVLCGKGGVIDHFDEVVRFNEFTTRGLEMHTGTKTTIWSTFGNGMLPQDDARPEKIIYVHGETGRPAYSPLGLWRIPRSYYQARRDLIRSASVLPDERRTLLRPSSGFLVASWLLDHGLERISLIGFDHFRKDRSRQHHYWVPKTFGKPVEHDGEAEAAVLSAFAAQGRITYLA